MRKLVAVAMLGIAQLLHAFVPPQIGQPAPAFAVRDPDGRLVTLADYDDRVVVLEWMDPRCTLSSELYDRGRLQALQTTAAERGAVWLTVVSARPDSEAHLDSDEAKVWLREHDVAVEGLLLDETGTMARAYGIERTPTFFVLGVDGRMTFRGGLDEAAATTDEQPGLLALAQALEATLANEVPVAAGGAGVGCALEL